GFTEADDDALLAAPGNRARQGTFTVVVLAIPLITGGNHLVYMEAGETQYGGGIIFRTLLFEKFCILDQNHSDVLAGPVCLSRLVHTGHYAWRDIGLVEDVDPLVTSRNV